MNRFDWTFSGSAEVVTAVLLVLAMFAIVGSIAIARFVAKQDAS